MSTFHRAFDETTALEQADAERQKDAQPSQSNDRRNAAAQAASKALQVKRELAAALLVENKNAVILGTDIVFFEPQDALHALVTNSGVDYQPLAFTRSSAISRKTKQLEKETRPDSKPKFSEPEINTSLLGQERQVIHLVPKPVEQPPPFPGSKHGASCECFSCRDNRKWEQRFEKRHGAAMRAYYGPR